MMGGPTMITHFGLQVADIISDEWHHRLLTGDTEGEGQ